MAVKLTAETLMTIDHDDLCAVLTDYLCSSPYGAFAEMRVTSVGDNNSGESFSLVLNPQPKEEEQQ